MSNKNNTPEQKAAWLAGSRPSRLSRIIPSFAYSPKPKEPSRRDLHRGVEARTEAQAQKPAQAPAAAAPAVRFGGIARLAKAARRIPRMMSRSLHKLRSGKKLTEKQVAYHHNQIQGAMTARTLLDHELEARNIGGPARRDTTPHRLRGPGYSWGQALAAANPTLAAVVLGAPQVCASLGQAA